MAAAAAALSLGVSGVAAAAPTGGDADPIVGDEAEDRAESSEVPNAHSSGLWPGPNQDCPQGGTNAFGNTDIYGGTYPDPTP